MAPSIPERDLHWSGGDRGPGKAAWDMVEVSAAPSMVLAKSMPLIACQAPVSTFEHLGARARGRARGARVCYQCLGASVGGHGFELVSGVDARCS